MTVKSIQGKALYSVTPEQYQFGKQLLTQFKKMSSQQKQALTSELERRDAALFQAIVKSYEIVQAGQVKPTAGAAKAQSISDLAKSCGWAEDSWQVKLLTALDGAGRFETDGKITAGELLTGLRQPGAGRYVTSSTVERLKALLATGPDGKAGATELINDLKGDWQKQLAADIDAASDKNGRLTPGEVEAYFAGNPQAHEKLADQNLGVLLHQIAMATGEPDPFKIADTDGTGMAVVRSSLVGSFDDKRLVSTVVAQAVTANDLKQRGDLDRKDNFHADELLPKMLAAGPSDYTKTGYDMGHLAAAADGTSRANVDASFSLLNMAPQLPKLNRFSWRYLEASVRDLVVATGARAVVYTGNLYLDDKGQALPDDKIKLIGKNHKIAVPTHCFKSVLFQLPDGRMSTMSFMIPNREDLPTDVNKCKELIRNSRVALADVERMAGIKLFEGLIPMDAAPEMKADKTATVPVPAGTKIDATDFLWGNKPNDKTWAQAIQPYEIDAALDQVAQAMALVQGSSRKKTQEPPLARIKAAIDAAVGDGKVTRQEADRVPLRLRISALSPSDRALAQSWAQNALRLADDPRAQQRLQQLLKLLGGTKAQSPST